LNPEAFISAGSVKTAIHINRGCGGVIMGRENDDNRVETFSGRSRRGGFFGSLRGPDRGMVRFAIKVALGLLVFFVVFYLIFYAKRYGEAVFVLSNHEILNPAAESGSAQLSFAANDRVYFFVGREGKSINADLAVIEIEIHEGGAYRHYKQITYEIEKSFPRLASYIPGEYFSRSGRYRVKALLDGKIVSTKEVVIN